MIRKLLLTVLFVVLILGAVLGLYFFYKNSTSDRVAMVGKEVIYKNLYDFENTNTPDIQGLDRGQFILEKLTKDSIVLQAAANENLITLTADVFNSPDVNPQKRVALVNTIRTTLDDESKSISGELISIWFVNGGVGKLGYEGSRAFARKKIDPIHARVKNGEITMVEAATIIKNDKTLSTIDPAYETNAYRTFNSDSNTEITHSPALDTLIRKSASGTTTDVVPITFQETILGRPAEVYYAFAHISENLNYKNGAMDFNEWYENNKSSYIVKKY